MYPAERRIFVCDVDSYDLLFCEPPPDEPTGVPARPDEYDGQIIRHGPGKDRDGDGIPDRHDNCKKVFNPVRPMDAACRRTPTATAAATSAASARWTREGPAGIRRRTGSTERSCGNLPPSMYRSIFDREGVSAVVKQQIGRCFRFAVAAVAALAVAGCGTMRAANTRLEQFDPNRGYRPYATAQHRDRGRVIIYLSFSGGGTRAAAFAYGVLEELRDTQIASNGGAISLLEEVDTISGVSGGSFPAAYYGLYDDRIFEEFEERFLKKNVQGALFLRALLPWNLLGLMTPWVSRSDLASRYYDKYVFDGATFSDLREAMGPRVHINATDLSSGYRFTFNRPTFDAICSDLEVFPISTAVAASSAVPVLLSPISMESHAGSCGYVPPAWLTEVLDDDVSEPRREYAARTFLSFTDRERKKFIHLVDGGISDNLGLRAAIDFMSAAGGAEGVRKIQGFELPDHIAVIVVNAETDPDPTIDLTLASPSFALLMNSVSGAQIRRYNFETLLLAEEMIQRAASELSTPERPVRAHMINVSFDGIADVEERRYFKTLPTNFKLKDEQVDNLRAAGRRLLRKSRDFQKLVEALR